MRTLEAAAGNWSAILNNFNLPPITGKKHFKGECPLCHKSSKFRISHYKDSIAYICTCSRGSGLELVARVLGISIKDAMQQIDAFLGIEWKPDENRKLERIKKMSALQEVIDYWKTLDFVSENNQSGRYLLSRGLDLLPRHGIRHEERRDGRAAMVAMVSDFNNNAAYQHLTFLKDGKKDDTQSVQKMLKRITPEQADYVCSPSIKLMNPTTDLLIAEGIESALAAGRILHLPAWSCCNAGLMEKFEAPAKVKHLHIFADSDPTGMKAAFIAANRNYHMHGCNVTVYFANQENQGQDANDILNNGTTYNKYSFLKKD